MGNCMAFRPPFFYAYVRLYFPLLHNYVQTDKTKSEPTLVKIVSPYNYIYFRVDANRLTQVPVYLVCWIKSRYFKGDMPGYTWSNSIAHLITSDGIVQVPLQMDRKEILLRDKSMINNNESYTIMTYIEKFSFWVVEFGSVYVV